MNINSTSSIPQTNNMGWELNEIKNLNLKVLRTSDLSEELLMGCVIFAPIAGLSLLILLCAKVYNIYKHHMAEKHMVNFDNLTNDKKIDCLTKAIKASGRLSWQYQFELARIKLLQSDYEAASKIANEARKLAPSPCQIVRVNESYLVSYVKRGPQYDDSDYKRNFASESEAKLYAAIYAANKQYVKAYYAYNDAILYNPNSLEKIRKGQCELVTIMKNTTNIARQTLIILEDEQRHEQRIKNLGISLNNAVQV